jgi:hypothetical protein
MRNFFLALSLLLGVWLFACQTPDEQPGSVGQPTSIGQPTPNNNFQESATPTASLTVVPRPEIRRTSAVGTATAAAALALQSATPTRVAATQPRSHETPIRGAAPAVEPIVTPTPQANPLPASAEAIPLTDMDDVTYLGFEGGLYPGGVNEMPQAHASEGLTRARLIQPLDTEGNPDPDGKYVVLSIGMSNTSMEFCRALGANSETDGVTCVLQSFMGLSEEDTAVNHNNLVMVNGARGAQVANTWDSSNEENYTHIRHDLLDPLGLSEAQVQIVWLKVANGDVGSDPSLPSDQADAYRLLATMGDIVRALKAHYPNLQQVFLSSRIYAGYANRDLNPEPYAYESGFAVKWLIEAQIRQMTEGRISPLVGDLNFNTVAPWLAWGPYLWADGTNPRSDGLIWVPEDFGNDGTHPSVIGREKVGALLLDFFKSSPYSHCWFLAEVDTSECDASVVQQEMIATVAPAPETFAFSGNGQAIPLTDFGNETYLGFEGGLYPEGSNEVPEMHAAEGLVRTGLIQPLNLEGNPDPNGKIVLLSIGMSNTMMEFCGEWVVYTKCESYSFIGKARTDAAIDHSDLVIVNGARGAQIARRWDSPDEANYDRTRDGFLNSQGFSEQQVQVIWLKVVDFLQGLPPLPSENAHAYDLMTTMGNIVRALKVRYPNLQQVFLSSRTYGGYATHDLSPEPYAYETGFAVKWLIEAQIQQMENGQIDPRVGDLDYNTVAPWLAWGPYLWTNGTEPRSDGLTWQPEDVNEEDGTHPSISGREKVANLLLEFFKTSPFTRCWFLEEVDSCS